MLEIFLAISVFFAALIFAMKPFKSMNKDLRSKGIIFPPSEQLAVIIVQLILLIMTYALSYQGISFLNKDAINGISANPSFYEFLYFSAVTITTYGSNDLTPVSTAAKLLTVFESCTGVIFVAYSIGTIVANIKKKQLNQTSISKESFKLYSSRNFRMLKRKTRGK